MASVSIKWVEAGQSLWKMDCERQKVLEQIIVLRDRMRENTEGFTGKEADKFRKEIAIKIGSEEYNGDDTLKAIYTKINELNYSIKKALKQFAEEQKKDISDINMDGSIGLTAEQGATAWDFVWDSNTENVELFGNSQLISNLGSMRDALETIDEQMGYYLIDLQNLVDDGLSTQYNQDLKDMGNKFGNIAREVHSAIEDEIKKIEQLGDKMWSTVAAFGADISNIES